MMQRNLNVWKDENLSKKVRKTTALIFSYKCLDIP